MEPSTIVRWRREGSKLVWKWISWNGVKVDKKSLNRELRGLIFRMGSENPIWGMPRIHGELKMLGFDISERTVLRWMRRTPRNPEPARQWTAFLSNHREAIAATDFFTLPTLTFGIGPSILWERHSKPADSRVRSHEWRRKCENGSHGVAR